jgi:predicted O-methyltransferase YrrM
MDMLALAYQEYINHVSSPLITLSRNRAAFLYFLCGLLKPSHILDLGSGFSSFVFRKYQKDHALQQIVTTIDDAPYWLDRTADFLRKHQLSTERMLPLRDFLSEEAPHYDLCFLDLGDLNARMHILPVLHERLLAHGSILLVDDLHVPAYRNHLENFCKKHNLQLYSLRKVTRRRLSHMGLIMKNPNQ